MKSCSKGILFSEPGRSHQMHFP